MHDVGLITSATTGRAHAFADNGVMVEVEDARFEEMVSEALDGLPPKLGRLMRNYSYEFRRASTQFLWRKSGRVSWRARQRRRPFLIFGGVNFVQ